MAYKTEDLERQALEAIKQHNLFFIEDLVAYLPCDKTTFYTHKLNENHSIKGALEQNRIQTKNGLRSKWYKSPNASMQIALYKLIADDSERKKIAQNYTDVTTDGQKLPTVIIGEQYASEPNFRVDNRTAEADDLAGSSNQE